MSDEKDDKPDYWRPSVDSRDAAIVQANGQNNLTTDGHTLQCIWMGAVSAYDCVPECPKHWTKGKYV